MDWTNLTFQELWEQTWVIRVLRGPYVSREKLLFMRLASVAPKYCLKSNKELAAELGCSNDTIRRAIRNLQNGGELVVTGRNNRDRRMYPARAPRA